MAQLSHHPSIVTIYHAAIAADGRPFLVMEYCSRPGLAERYRQERISVAEALRIGIRLASAVETAHRAGILHRDIKPANVLTTDFGWPALTDFGIAATTGHGRGCDGRHVDPVVAAGAAGRAPDGRRAVGRLLAGGDDLLAARRADPVRDRRRAEHRAAAGRPDRARAAAAHGPRRRARRACRSCSSAPWPSTRRAGSPPRRRSRARCSRSRPTSGCRSPRSTSWTRPTPPRTSRRRRTVGGRGPRGRDPAALDRHASARRPPSRRRAATPPGADEATRLRGVTYVAPEPAERAPWTGVRRARGGRRAPSRRRSSAVGRAWWRASCPGWSCSPRSWRSAPRRCGTPASPRRPDGDVRLHPGRRADARSPTPSRRRPGCRAPGRRTGPWCSRGTTRSRRRVTATCGASCRPRANPPRADRHRQGDRPRRPGDHAAGLHRGRDRAHGPQRVGRAGAGVHVVRWARCARGRPRRRPSSPSPCSCSSWRCSTRASRSPAWT